MHILIGLVLLAQAMSTDFTGTQQLRMPALKYQAEADQTEQDGADQIKQAQYWQAAKLANQVYCAAIRDGTPKTSQEILNSAPMFKMANVTWDSKLECFANQEFIDTAIELRIVVPLLNQYLERQRHTIEHPTPAAAIGYASQTKIINKDYAWYLIKAVALFDIVYNRDNKTFESKSVELPKRNPIQRSGIEESK